jgi:hypothetical protein
MRCLAVISEAPRELEAALPVEQYVDEHDIGLMRARLPKSVRARGRDGRDRQAVALEQRTGGLQENPAVIDDQAADAHHKSVATDLPSHNPASRNSEALEICPVEVLIGIGALARRTRLPAVALGLALTVAVWVLGQDLGALYSGQATDPNTAPLLAVMGIALLAGYRQTAASSS